MTTATWISQDVLAGGSVPGAAADSVITTQSGAAIGPPIPVGTIRKFSDSTGKYGVGEFIYLPGAASLAVGDVVSYQLSAGVAAATDAVVTRWAGTANFPCPLAVSMTANTSPTAFSWFQISGAAVVNTNGTVAAGDKAYWQATATVSSTPVAGKQIDGMTAFSANGVPAANQAVYTIQRISAQGSIT